MGDNLGFVRDLVEEELTGYGLYQEGWRFNWCRTTRTMARCHYGTKLIEVSKHWAKIMTDFELKQTILHELAHALSYNIYGWEGMGHGVNWKKVAKEIGVVVPKHAMDTLKTPEHTWEVYCKLCNKTLKKMYRKPSSNYNWHTHRGCGGNCRIMRVA